VAIIENGRLVAHTQHDGWGRHGERILPMVEQLMANGGYAPSALDRIGVGVGPGSFTGLRVGIALAQGIALAHDLPVFGVGSLEAMAHAVPLELPGLRCPMLDARRGELFVAAYDSELVLRVPPRALAPETVWASLLAECPGPVVATGEVAEAHAPSVQVYRSERADLPSAQDVALLAEARPLSSAGAAPVYVRDADAVLPKLRRIALD
jgi:tRNA threonylcarbamoyladenosine biosynthesis protein TsaB